MFNRRYTNVGIRAWIQAGLAITAVLLVVHYLSISPVTEKGKRSVDRRGAFEHNDRKGTNTPPLKLYTFSEGAWRPNVTVCQQDVLDKLKTKDYFQKGYITTDYGTINMFLNNPEEDFISRDVHEKHIWEPHVFNTIYKHIRNDPEIDIVDIGANLGVFSLQFANMGRRIISVEAAFQCVQHLCASIAENGFTDKITVVHNAMGSDHQDVPFVLPSKGEFALGFVEQEDLKMRKDMSKMWGPEVYSKRTVPVKSATLDNISEMPEFQALRKVLIKMDVQGFEHKVLEGADRFFTTGKLQALYMEWTWHRNKTSGDYMLKKFADWNFEPYDCNTILKDRSADLNQACIKADVSKSGLWPDDILWLPIGSPLKRF